jgi:hypothetical protein
MVRRFVSALVLVVLLGSIALADTVKGLITAIEEKDGKTTIVVYSKKNDEDSKIILNVGKNTKIYKTGAGKKTPSKLSELKDQIKRGKKIKGAFATIEEDKGNAKAITFYSFKGSPSPKKEKDKTKEKEQE